MEAVLDVVREVVLEGFLARDQDSTDVGGLGQADADRGEGVLAPAREEGPLDVGVAIGDVHGGSLCNRELGLLPKCAVEL